MSSFLPLSFRDRISAPEHSFKRLHPRQRRRTLHQSPSSPFRRSGVHFASGEKEERGRGANRSMLTRWDERKEGSRGGELGLRGRGSLW